MPELILTMMINSWRSPVNLEHPPGDWRNKIFVGKRMQATISADEETIQAIKDGMNAGFIPEFWGMKS